MKAFWFTVVICFVFAALLTPQALAQSCPPGTTNPDQVIAGQTWVFDTRAADYGPNGMASIGFFKAQIGASGRGVLTVNETVSGTTFNGAPQYPVRLANVPGSYQVYPDCSGGQLAFHLNNQAVQWEFVFANGLTTMYMVSQSLLDNSGLTKSLRGVAVLGAPAGCPAGLADPSQLLNGSTWSFHTESASFEGAGQGRVGIFKPFFVAANVEPKNPYPHGLVTATESLSYNGFPAVYRLASESGRYLVYPNCSGGQISIGGTAAVTYEFVFVGQNFTEMRLLSDALTRVPNAFTNTGDILGGTAVRY